MKKSIGIIYFAFIFLFTHASTANAQSWHSWLNQFRIEAIADGIEPDFFDRTFAGVELNHRILNFDRTQPEKRLTFLKYRNTRADSFRISLGKKEYQRHQETLEKIADHYHVDACFIVSLWGMETSYGRFKGDFDVIKALATLAFDSRRGDFFRKELLLALHILQDGHVTRSNFRGEWAGGSGHPQFLPSSWHRYAVDYNGDGRKDIWTSLDDVFASIANYLASNGWKNQEPWAIPVVLPPHFDESLVGYKVNKTVREWQALGVRAERGSLPEGNEQAWVVEPLGGPSLLVFNNFRVIMTYNNSTFYAGTIGYMADKICSRPVYAYNTHR